MRRGILIQQKLCKVCLLRQCIMILRLLRRKWNLVQMVVVVLLVDVVVRDLAEEEVDGELALIVFLSC